MKLFKKINIKGFENLEINEDGYILDTNTKLITKLDSFYTIEGYSCEELIKNTFENGK